MTQPLDSATNQAIFAIARMVQKDLLANYADESDDARERAMAQILACGGAALDSAGKVRYSRDVLSIAPRLVGGDIAIGNSDVAKCGRALASMQRCAPLARGSGSMADARAQIRELPALPLNASDEMRLRRATELTLILERAGLGLEDPDGD